MRLSVYPCKYVADLTFQRHPLGLQIVNVRAFRNIRIHVIDGSVPTRFNPCALTI